MVPPVIVNVAEPTLLALLEKARAPDTPSPTVKMLTAPAIVTVLVPAPAPTFEMPTPTALVPLTLSVRSSTL